MRPHGLGTPLRLLVAACLLAGCGPSFVVDGVPLEGTSWVLVAAGGQPPVAGREPNLVFRDGTVSAWFGCNGGGAQSVEIHDGSIVVHEMISTAMACSGAGEDPLDNPVMRTESAYYAALMGASHIAIRAGRLVISGTGGEVVLRRLQPGETLGHL